MEQGHSVCKIGSQDGMKVNNAGFGLRESPKNSLTSKVSKAMITKKNEKRIGEGQRDIERGVDYLQLVPVTTVELNAKEAAVGLLDTLGKQEEECSGGTLLELDQNKRGPAGMCVETKKHGS